ncbi:TPA: dolichyl-phosphate beta-D-mannosyltransferase [Candidatus Uhrbacteria bacterium]|nr:dolichyl-phosphate beta-D-mannosyltransferase [Candidatus Uhrbacteria bacterium]
MKTLVVIPTYNERENLETVIHGVLDLVSVEVDLLVVDDASPDGTGRLADDLVRLHPNRVHVLHRPTRFGLGDAYLDGFRLAIERGYEAVCELDADGSHDPVDLVRLIAAVRDGADVAIGSRRVPGGRVEDWGWQRRIMSQCASSISRVLLKLKTRDASAGFRCLGRRAVEVLLSADIRSRGYAFQEESLFWLERSGCQIVELPVVFHNRRLGRSKASWREVVGLIAVLIRLRFGVGS